MRTCTICTNEKRNEIDASLLSGMAHYAVSRKFGVGRMSVVRHAQEHIAKAVQQSKSAREEMKGLDVVAQLKAINGVSLQILQDARKAEKPHLALQAIDRIERQLMMQAKLLGDIDKPTEVNIWLPASWEMIEAAIHNALKSHPEARVKVVEALSQLEKGK